MKTYRHPDTKTIKTVNDGADVKEAALKKLGYVEITGADIEAEAGLTVTYEQVTSAKVPAEPPALPKLTTPIAPGPTRDSSPTAPPITASTAPTGKSAEREDVEPLSKDKK